MNEVLKAATNPDYDAIYSDRGMRKLLGEQLRFDLGMSGVAPWYWNSSVSTKVRGWLREVYVPAFAEVIDDIERALRVPEYVATVGNTTTAGGGLVEDGEYVSAFIPTPNERATTRQVLNRLVAGNFTTPPEAQHIWKDWEGTLGMYDKAYPLNQEWEITAVERDYWVVEVGSVLPINSLQFSLRPRETPALLEAIQAKVTQEVGDFAAQFDPKARLQDLINAQQEEYFLHELCLWKGRWPEGASVTPLIQAISSKSTRLDYVNSAHRINALASEYILNPTDMKGRAVFQPKDGANVLLVLAQSNNKSVELIVRPTRERMNIARNEFLARYASLIDAEVRLELGQRTDNILIYPAIVAKNILDTLAARALVSPNTQVRLDLTSEVVRVLASYMPDSDMRTFMTSVAETLQECGKNVYGMVDLDENGDMRSFGLQKALEIDDLRFQWKKASK